MSSRDQTTYETKHGSLEPRLRVGTAGWSIAREQAAEFPGTGAHLVRYGAVLGCAEINSSFYRPHRASTYERWAASTPESFRFSVKVPKAITHECGLAPTRGQIEGFLEEVRPLGAKLGPLLLQLPPKQAFAEPLARSFLSALRECVPEGKVVIEPRNAGWFTAEAASLLRDFNITRVAADPPRRGDEGAPDVRDGLMYFRLHGSPRVYYSSYSEEYLEMLCAKIRAALANGVATELWCIFDNTASGAALGNALTLKQSLNGP